MFGELMISGFFIGAAGGAVTVHEQGAAGHPVRWELCLRGVQDTQSVNSWKPCVERDLAEPPKCLTQSGSCSLVLVLSFLQGKVGNGYCQQRQKWWICFTDSP